MASKISQTLLFIILESFAVIIQFSLISAGPAVFNQINLVLIVLIFILFFFGFRQAAWSALLMGFWLDAISFKFFGWYLIILFLTLLAAHGLLKNWLTNRSLYSFLALIMAATIANNFLVAIFSSFWPLGQGSFLLGQKNFWLDLVYQSAWSLLAALLLFNLVAYLTKRFRPVFLEKKSGL